MISGMISDLLSEMTSVSKAEFITKNLKSLYFLRLAVPGLAQFAWMSFPDEIFVKVPVDGNPNFLFSFFLLHFHQSWFFFLKGFFCKICISISFSNFSDPFFDEN